MKRILLLITVCMLIITSCSNSIYNRNKDEFQVYHEKIYDDLIKDIKKIELPEFTVEEQELIDYYKENTLKIGQINQEYFYTSIDGESIGVNYYTVLILEELLGIKTEVYEIDFLNFQEHLATGYCDIVVGVNDLNLTEENLQVTNPYAFNRIFAYSMEKLSVNEIEDFNGLRIGIPNNLKYVTESDIYYLSEFGIDAELKIYESNVEAIEAYYNDEIDIILDNISPTLMQNGFFIDRVNADIFAKKLRFGYNELNIHKDFISAIEKIFDNYEVKENIRTAERRGYQVFLNKGLLFTTEELSYIEKTKVDPVKLKSVQFLDPLSYINLKSGEYDGAIVEVWNRVSKVSGLEYETIVNFGEKYQDMFKEIEDGLIDGAMIKIYNLSDEKYLYTNPIFEAKFVLVGAEKSPFINTTNSLNNYDIGVVNDTVASRYIHKKVNQENIVDYYDNTIELIEGLKNGEVDFVILNEYLYNKMYYVDEQYELTNITNLDYSGDLISIFNKDNEDNKLLVSIFNKSLYGIDIEELETEFLNTRINIGILLNTLKFNTYIIYFAFLIIIIIGALLIIQWKRKFKLADKISKIDILTQTSNRYCLKQDYVNGFSKDEIILYMNLNNFKNVNDIFGHKTGDFILIEYVRQLKQIPNSKVYRFGGDEFILVLSGKNIDEDGLFNCINKCLETSIEDKENNTVHKVKASIGIVNLNIFEENMRDYSYILSVADFTMYLAKRDKKNSYKICDHHTIKIQKSMYAIERKMEKPISETGLVPYFQPIFDLYDNKIVGFEVLARWKDKDTIFYPDEFIPIVEKIGNIHILDLFMFEEALTKFEHWLDEGLIDTSMYITSNFSGITLLSIDVNDINAIVSRHKVDKKNFIIEITESFFIDETAMDLVVELKANGYNIAIDDFSAGHSSLNTLVKIDMDLTKIDKELVGSGRIMGNHIKEKSKVVLKNVIKLVKELDSDIIVEGIEDEETIKMLKEFGDVRKVQGYYFSKPIDEESIKKFIIKVNKLN